MDRIKFSSEAPVTLGILQMLGSVPREVENQVVDLLSKKASAVMTNVPGPREELHFKGRRLSHMMFWVPRAGDVSMGVSILSYAGEVLLGIATDLQLVPDPETIVATFHEEFEALQTQFT
jgi:diacylglycerol O-acyltransferase